MNPVVALVGGFLPLTNATKTSILGNAAALDSPLEHYNVF